MSASTWSASPEGLAASVREHAANAARAFGTKVARKPGHRVKFQWPPHAVSHDFHILPEEWNRTTTFKAHGEEFLVEMAQNGYGVFGRCDELWLEAKGASEVEMLRNMQRLSAPLFERQFAMNRALLMEGRHKTGVRESEPTDLLKLLYCEDRDVAHEAQVEIETHASLHIFNLALLEILRDREHPMRRIAQWCVLDLFEDLPSYFPDDEGQKQAVDAMSGLLWDAEDDYARTVFKAGVVLGGHVPPPHGSEALIRCLEAPSRIGRRSAIHGLFHAVEWRPEIREAVAARLAERAEAEPDPQLRQFASLMAKDIAGSEFDHAPEPVFEGE